MLRGLKSWRFTSNNLLEIISLSEHIQLQNRLREAKSYQPKIFEYLLHMIMLPFQALQRERNGKYGGKSLKTHSNN